jgi:hypothetical protein
MSCYNITENGTQQCSNNVHIPALITGLQAVIKYGRWQIFNGIKFIRIFVEIVQVIEKYELAWVTDRHSVHNIMTFQGQVPHPPVPR